MDLPINYNDLTPYWRKRVREEYIRLQKGLCFYCNSPLNEQPPESIRNKRIDWSLFPANFLKYPVHLQHNHNTGLTQGAVHSYCNAVMWQYENR